jgi:hypothetical protein
VVVAPVVVVLGSVVGSVVVLVAVLVSAKEQVSGHHEQAQDPSMATVLDSVTAKQACS